MSSEKQDDAQNSAQNSDVQNSDVQNSAQIGTQNSAQNSAQNSDVQNSSQIGAQNSAQNSDMQHSTHRELDANTQAQSAISMQLAGGFEVMLITGMSGAGRSHAANALEDMGWYVIDNLPPKLLIPLVDMMTSSGSKVHKLAAVIDVRSRGYFDDLFAVLAHIDELGVKTRILFLDASDSVLIKRYESVRRPHPLQRGGRLIDGILEERELLGHLKDCADIIIDTSNLSIHQLSTKLYESLLGKGSSTVSVHIFSFGFKYGIPMDADFVADMRFLPNPFWVPQLRDLTGKDKAVSDYVLSNPAAAAFLDSYEKALLTAIDGFAKEDKHYVTIAVGCTGGQHRSVAVSIELARRLRLHGLQVTVSARELQRRS